MPRGLEEASNSLRGFGKTNKPTNKLSSEKNPHHVAVCKRDQGLLLLRDFFSPVLLKLVLEAHSIVLGQPKPMDLFFGPPGKTIISSGFAV